MIRILNKNYSISDFFRDQIFSHCRPSQVKIYFRQKVYLQNTYKIRIRNLNLVKLRVRSQQRFELTSIPYRPMLSRIFLNNQSDPLQKRKMNDFTRDIIMSHWTMRKLSSILNSQIINVICVISVKNKRGSRGKLL